MKRKDKILVVDDNAVNLAIIEELLDDAYLVEMAENGHEALEIASQFHPDLILLDIMMPGIDGYETCRRFRADPVLCKAKIIMVSAKAMLADRLEGYKAGADDYLTKPFEEAEFLAKIRVYLNLKSVEEVEQLKDDILTLISHESFTPLNGILMSTEILQKGKSSDDEARELIQIIHESAEILNTFMKKIMTFSSLKSDTYNLELKEGSLVSIVDTVCKNLSDDLSKKHITLNKNIQANPPLVLDIKQIETSVANILDNAIQFSPEGGQIDISIMAQEQKIVLTIQDQGIGIDPKKLPFVFEAFHEMDIQHHSNGHRLGLAMSKLIIEKHQGSIQIASKPENGTRVSIQLPIQN